MCRYGRLSAVQTCNIVMRDMMQGLYAWWQLDLCDVFIELVKPAVQLDDSDASAREQKQAFRDTLWLCLDTGLRCAGYCMPTIW